MASKVLLKKSSVAAKAPVAGDLDYGELAINYTDGKIYYKKADNTIDYFASGAASAPVTSVGGFIGAVSAANLMTAIQTVDGTGSGLDADTLDGNHASAFYLASNPSGYTSNTGTVTSVGATAPVVSSGGTAPTISMAAATASVNGYMTSTYASKLDGIAAGATNVTNTNQLTNGAGYITGITSANVTTALGYTPYDSTNPSGYITSAASITGNAATATSSPLVSALGSYVWSASALPNSYNLGIQAAFVGPAAGEGLWQNYGSVMTMRTYSGGGGSLQMYVPYSPSNGGTGMQVRFGNYDVSSGNSWTSWKTLLASDNYAAYSTFSGTVIASQSGFQSATYATGRNRIWSFGNADGYGISYFQGTGGYGGSDSIGIHFGTAAAANSQFTFRNNGDFIATANVTAYSDETLKTNWRDLPNDFIERLAEVKHGTYDRLDIELTQDGVSAQSLKPLLPNSILKDSEGILSVNYGGAAMVSAVALAERVVQQDKRIAELERLIAKIIGD